ncbi:MAG: tRNA (N(6)-L-threonylcarbamoyladenosine(37)-C(2))-methylthiotransferase MtaB [Clostridia bacterium]
MSRKVVVFNLGCKVNQYECDSLIGGLRDKGYTAFSELVAADVYIINTCAVTSEAERKSRQIISRIKHINPDAFIMVSGCASQANQDYYIKKGIPFVSGVQDRDKILDYIGKSTVFDSAIPNEYQDTIYAPTGDRTRAYVKIQDGCDNFCSYCIIPHLRGRSRSREVQAAKREIELLSQTSGEIVITGINLSKYGKDNNTSLAALINQIKDTNARIRLGSFYVEGVNKELLDALFSLKNFCPHFHLSLQHGDNGVLRDMNRHYTADEYLQKAEMIRSYNLNAAITTDIIVGYPTETEEAFVNTLQFAKRARFADIHIFPFSKREGTKAAALPMLSSEIIKDRRERLTAVKDDLRIDYLNKMLQTPQKVLFEGDSGGLRVGYSEYYIRVYAATKEKQALVIPKEIYKDGLKGDVING